jgi:hypothetical protein
MARTCSTAILALCGFFMVGMGVYFVLLRPPLLAEDLRYIGSTPRDLELAVPGLSTWLEKVFWVMGGYIISTGALTVYLATTAFRRGTTGALGIASLVWATSIGWMATVNWVIDSDYRWLLTGVALVWGIALFIRLAERQSPLIEAR